VGDGRPDGLIRPYRKEKKKAWRLGVKGQSRKIRLKSPPSRGRKGRFSRKNILRGKKRKKRGTSSYLYEGEKNSSAGAEKGAGGEDRGGRKERARLKGKEHGESSKKERSPIKKRKKGKAI